MDDSSACQVYFILILLPVRFCVMHLFKAPKSIESCVGLKSEIEQEHECLTCGWDPRCRANVLGKA